MNDRPDQLDTVVLPAPSYEPISSHSGQSGVPKRVVPFDSIGYLEELAVVSVCSSLSLKSVNVVTVDMVMII